MSETTSTQRYSTIADFELLALGKSYDVSQVAGEFIILARPAKIPPCEAELFITVEGKRRCRRIRLPHGASLESDWVTIERLPDADAASVPTSEESARCE